MKCPHCGAVLQTPQTLSKEAARTLRYMIEHAPARGGYMFEGARPAYEAGKYHDAEIAELLRAGAIRPHADAAKGWVVTPGQS